MLRFTARFVAVVFVCVPLALQLVPYRVQNPLVTQEPEWDSPQTRAIAQRACFDCHSNETSAPWYAQVAPVAWIVRSHVEQAREKLNLSEMDRPHNEAGGAAQKVRKGQMPPSWYVALHPEAELTPDERHALTVGLEATFDERDVAVADATAR